MLRKQNEVSEIVPFSTILTPFGISGFDPAGARPGHGECRASASGGACCQPKAGAETVQRGNRRARKDKTGRQSSDCRPCCDPAGTQPQYKRRPNIQKQMI